MRIGRAGDVKIGESKVIPKQNPIKFELEKWGFLPLLKADQNRLITASAFAYAFDSAE